MITSSFDKDTPAIINPARKTGAVKLDFLIITFSYMVEAFVLNTFNCMKIAELNTVSARVPVYKIDVPDVNVGFFKTYVGAPATVGIIEDAISEIDVKNIIVFGGSGTLDNQISRGKIIIPTEAYRDEGTSYHYIPANSDYIRIKNCSIVDKFMANEGITHVSGKTWTTDAIYRETRGNFEKRKSEGCLAVEMECSAVQALCDFRGINLYYFLKSGDLLDSEKWESRGEFGECGSQHDPIYFMIALKLAKYILDNQ